MGCDSSKAEDRVGTTCFCKRTRHRAVRDIHNRTCVPIRTSHSSDWRNTQIRLCALVGSRSRTQPAGGLPTQYLGVPYMDHLDPECVTAISRNPRSGRPSHRTLASGNDCSRHVFRLSTCNLLNTTITGLRGSKHEKQSGLRK